MNGEQIVTQLLPQLGFAAIFLVMLGMLWQYVQRKDAEHQTDIREKNEVIRKQNELVLTAFVENTKMFERLDATVKNNTETIQEVKTLTSKLWETIIHDNSSPRHP